MKSLFGNNDSKNSKLIKLLGLSQHLVKEAMGLDLKPDNLCDFGLSKQVLNTDSYSQSKAKHTADVGNMDYMAPEATGEHYNHKIDIYSLALIGADIFGYI
ncbi:unnamed protein product [Oppiella nova]|uniref:Protein kinase domain-containing protein n=1 Tax=Oppiella nova TaxID=334625 RepID=A0A7R9M515_9ACAR|nr:unnamed protein product [Oppiella nova]CAG2169741.1 unnamed protein product [Oppiella nova]